MRKLACMRHRVCGWETPGVGKLVGGRLQVLGELVGGRHAPGVGELVGGRHQV